MEFSGPDRRVGVWIIKLQVLSPNRASGPPIMAPQLRFLSEPSQPSGPLGMGRTVTPPAVFPATPAMAFRVLLTGIVSRAGTKVRHCPAN